MTLREVRVSLLFNTTLSGREKKSYLVEFTQHTLHSNTAAMQGALIDYGSTAAISQNSVYPYFCIPTGQCLKELYY